MNKILIKTPQNQLLNVDMDAVIRVSVEKIEGKGWFLRFHLYSDNIAKSTYFSV